MIEQKQLEAWKRIFDTVMTPPQRRRNDHYELAKRVRLIAADLSLSGEQETANVLYEAAEAIAERP
jgi:hypothetical protein